VEQNKVFLDYLERLNELANGLQSYVLIADDEKISDFIDQIDDVAEKIKNIFSSVISDEDPEADSLFRHIHFVKYFFREKKDYKWLGTNLFDIVKNDIPNLRLKVLKNSDLLKTPLINGVINETIGYTRKKQQLFQNPKLNETEFKQIKLKIIEADNTYLNNPNQALQSIAEAIEILCNEYCKNNNIQGYESKSGMSLHRLVFESISQKAGSMDKLFFQTACSHTLKRCNIKKHNYYNSNIIEMQYLIAESILAIEEIFKYL
jgi:hypothetical protein